MENSLTVLATWVFGFLKKDAGVQGLWTLHPWGRKAAEAKHEELLHGGPEGHFLKL